VVDRNRVEGSGGPPHRSARDAVADHARGLTVERRRELGSHATPEELASDWNFYLAYNLFRLAAILQGIAKRVETGTASSAQAKASAAGARPLAQMAWDFAQRSQRDF